MNESDDFHIVIGPETGKKEFSNIGDLQNWVSAERQVFGWLTDIAHRTLDGHNAWDKINQWLNIADEFIEAFRKHPDDEKRRESNISHYRGRLDGSRAPGATVLSHSADAAFVFQLQKEQGSFIAAAALAYLLNLDLQSKVAPESIFWVLQYRQGNIGTVEVQKKTLEELKETWDIHFKNQHSKFNEKNKKLADEFESLQEEILSIKDRINQQHAVQKKQFSKMLEEGRNELLNIEATYDNKLALQSSIDYWTKKRTHHENVMFPLFFATILVGLITTFVFLNKADDLLDGTVTQIPYLRLSILLGVSALGVWVTRIFAKIFISNLHLRTDADERITMIQTYLALLREGNGPKEDERQLILQTLFRPSSTGFIKEEGPSGFLELVKIFKKD